MIDMGAILKVKELNQSLEFSIDEGVLIIKTFEEDENNSLSKISEVTLDGQETGELLDFLRKRVHELD